MPAAFQSEGSDNFADSRRAGKSDGARHSVSQSVQNLLNKVKGDLAATFEPRPSLVSVKSSDTIKQWFFGCGGDDTDHGKGKKWQITETRSGTHPPPPSVASFMDDGCLSRTTSNETLAASIAYPEAPPPSRIQSLDGDSADMMREKEEARRSVGFRALDGIKEFFTR